MILQAIQVESFACVYVVDVDEKEVCSKVNWFH